MSYMTKKTTEELFDYFFEKVKPFQDKLIENGWIKNSKWESSLHNWEKALLVQTICTHFQISCPWIICSALWGCQNDTYRVALYKACDCHELWKPREEIKNIISFL